MARIYPEMAYRLSRQHVFLAGLRSRGLRDHSQDRRDDQVRLVGHHLVRAADRKDMLGMRIVGSECRTCGPANGVARRPSIMTPTRAMCFMGDPDAAATVQFR
jgi:hypothetical protein